MVSLYGLESSGSMVQGVKEWKRKWELLIDELELRGMEQKMETTDLWV